MPGIGIGISPHFQQKKSLLSYWETHFVWGLRTIVVDTGSIKLDWVNVGNNAVAIERSLDGTSFTQVGTAAAGAETYTDTGLATATDYWYRIRPYSGSQYGDYTSIQADRTLPSSNKYPFVETTNWNNANHAIKDIRLYVPDATETYYVYQCGYVSGVWKLQINRQSDDAEVITYSWDAASYFDKDDFVKLDISSRPTATDNLHGYIVFNVGAVTNGIQYSWTMPSNEPNIVSTCIVETVDPVQALGTSLMITPSHVISDVASLYAHESSLYVDDDVLLVAYAKNLAASSEDAATEAAILAVINKTDYSTTEHIIAKAGGTYGGMNFSTSTPVKIPRIMKLSDGTIRIYFFYNTLTYYRDYNPAADTLGNTTEFKAIISGGTEPVSLTQANIKAHCEAVTSTTSAFFNANYFLFRDAESFYDNGDGNLYCVGEFINSLPGSFTLCYPVFMKSSDGGTTWTLLGISYLPASGVGSKPRYLESEIIYYNDKWHLSCRLDDYVTGISESSDDGVTWSAFDIGNPAKSIGYNFPVNNIALRRACLKQSNVHILAYSHRWLAHRTSGKERSALAIAYINGEMGNQRLRAVANNENLIHYPSIAINGKYLYLAYTTAELTGGGQNAIKNTIRIAKIALTDL